jgi:M6 family metalloprotease-like protein
MTRIRCLLFVPITLLLIDQVLAVAPPPSPLPLPTEFQDYATVRTAKTTSLGKATPTVASSQPGYLGLALDLVKGKLTVTDVEVNSPARKAGILVGDTLARVADKPASDVASVAEVVRTMGPGEKLPLVLEREGKPLELTVTLSATSRPLTAGPRVVLGVTLEAVPDGIKLTGVSANSAAEKAKLRVGDILTAIDGEKLAGKTSLESLNSKRPGDEVQLSVKRGDKNLQVAATLTAEPGAREGRGKGGAKSWDDRSPRIFTKPVYRLALVGIEYPDVKHNPKISPSDWENALFSTRKYNTKSVTGEKVYGSMNDYWLEQSNGKFRVEGKMFDWVTVKKKRGDYTNDTNRNALLTEVLDRLLERDGKTALDNFDGVFFVYAGDRVSTNRGGLYWPHRATLRYNGRGLPYFICPEGGRAMASISVITHEFGHMLGLPDLYARPEVPGQEGLGVWCTMSVGHGRDGKPLHISTWCKIQLGWVQPATIDPRDKQKLVLSPIYGSPKECYRVLIRPDGSEYLLLENRVRKGFDRDLPAEGLLIWRVVDGRPVLEESHGISGPSGPTLFLGSIPYPSGSNTAFTPYTTPSSRSLKGGGLPVYISNIRKLDDGRIAFQIGYEYF